ncbi:MAG: nitroreductase family protein, partial [Ramlibacter sp.]|nr:nitroreductase family protein [Ramlibacter sp.]
MGKLLVAAALLAAAVLGHASAVARSAYPSRPVLMGKQMALGAGDLDKTRDAPVTVIVANDTQFYEHMPQVWHQPGARETFEGNAALAQATASRNGTLGGAYFMIAARAVGL